MIRLFIALKIPSDIVEKVIEFRNEVVVANSLFKWEPVDKLHLTLKFIGEFPEEKLSELIHSLSFLNHLPKMRLKLGRFGFFFSKKDPRILWIGLNSEKNLVELVEKLNRVISIFGIEPEVRKFKAHLTLLRIKNNFPGELIKKFEEYDVPELSFVSEKIILFKSELKPSGSVYTEIKSFDLN
jgi:2'-5' RNA ligase